MTCRAELEYLQSRAREAGLVVTFFYEAETGGIDGVYIGTGQAGETSVHDPLSAAELLRGVFARKGIPSWRDHCESVIRESEQTVKTRW